MLNPTTTESLRLDADTSMRNDAVSGVKVLLTIQVVTLGVGVPADSSPFLTCSQVSVTS